MTGRKIPQAFIDDLLTRVDIVELIGNRVPLKKAGKDYQARCPFHDEKTPSFTVSQDKQFYHCFGCGAHGTAIGFLMEHDRLGFLEAVEALAQQTGLEIPGDARTPKGPDTRPLYPLLEQVTSYFRAQLSTHPRAIEYLKRRGLSGRTAAAFGLGYAPPGWDNLLRHLGANREAVEQLEVSGMLAGNDEGRRYDRFRDRIMFPIRDQRGRTIAFGGRVLGDEKPKYLNSPETPLFHKGRELYGLFEAHRALRRMDRVVLVEGYMDVIALAQFGIPYAVATLGTAVTPEHLERLFRVTPEIVFCLDGDRAGREAAWKALNNALPLMREGRQARFLFLPGGEDPDSMIRREGQDAFERRVRDAIPLSDFLFDKLSQGLDTSSLDGRARLAEQAKPLLNQLPAGVFREMMYQRLAEVVGLSPTKLGAQSPTDHRHPTRRALLRRGPRRISLQLRAMALLMQHTQLAHRCPELDPAWRTCQAPGAELFGKILDLLRIEPNLTTAVLLERWRGTEEGVHLARAAALDLAIPDGDEGEEFLGAVQRLTEQYRGQELERLLEKSTTAAVTAADKQRLMQLLQARSSANDRRED